MLVTAAFFFLVLGRWLLFVSWGASPTLSKAPSFGKICDYCEIYLLVLRRNLAAVVRFLARTSYLPIFLKSARRPSIRGILLAVI